MVTVIMNIWMDSSTLACLLGDRVFNSTEAGIPPPPLLTWDLTQVTQLKMYIKKISGK